MRRGFHDLIAQQFSTIFSAGCYFSDYTKQNHISAFPTTPTKSTICVVESGFTFSFSPIVEFALHPQHETSFVLGRRPVQDFKQEATPSKGMKPKGIKGEQRDNYEH